MKFIAEIDIMPHQELLDPQGKTVAKNMNNVDVEGIEDVRIGKHVRLDIDAVDEASAKEKVEAACERILVNAIMEKYTYTLVAVE